MQKYDKSYGQHFGRNLRALRKSQNLTMRELGERVGLAYQTINRYERGFTPTMLTALMLADYFGVTLDELIKPAVPAAW